MTALGSLVRSLEDPQVPISSAEIAALFPGGRLNDAGVSVNETRVYGLSPWFRGIALTAGTLAYLPLKVYKKGTRERVTAKTVLDSPNRRQTPFEFRQTLVANAMSNGTGFVLKRRDRMGAVRETWNLHPSRVATHEVVESDEYPDGLRFEVANPDGSRVSASSWEIARFPYLSPHGTLGLSVIDVARQALGIAVAAENTSAKFYGSGTMVSGILRTEQTLEDDDAARLKARWQAKVAGGSNAMDIAVLDKGADFTQVQLNPADAELLESRQFSISEIARYLGMPPELLGGSSTSSMTYQTIDGLTLGWVKFGLQSWITMLEERVTREFLPGGWDAGPWFAEHVLEGLLRGDPKSRAEFYASGVQNGWMLRSEPRERENLPPIPGLDVPLFPKGVTTLVDPDGQPETFASAPQGVPNDAAAQ